MFKQKIEELHSIELLSTHEGPHSICVIGSQVSGFGLPDQLPSVIIYGIEQNNKVIVSCVQPRRETGEVGSKSSSSVSHVQVSIFSGSLKHKMSSFIRLISLDARAGCILVNRASLASVASTVSLNFCSTVSS